MPVSGRDVSGRGVDEDDVRAVALALPATAERVSWGTPAFFVKDRLLARVHERPATLVVPVADLTEKEALLAADPRVFSTTAHYDGKPYVLVALDAVTAEELRELLTDAWRARAPRTLVRRHAQDGEPPAPRPV
ncbi:MmcQ/YjbR family DNA-binding protein [Kineococcus sp. NUM-3379]